ncbi:MAG: hypothetical protein A2018_04120 [Alphaproteobacteria bacterium GWF2_58_20]|nr:MAG: hypothetical protein A2018_04120 [Alphaproteobacteria bacterium GWF2_58_20]
MKLMKLKAKQRLFAGIGVVALCVLAGSAILYLRHRARMNIPLPAIMNIPSVMPVAVPLPQNSTQGQLPVIPLPVVPLPSIPDNRPKIAILIDDMGVNRHNSEAMMELDSAVSLSFLPYADNLLDQVDKASDKGHEIWLHLPMEPVGKADPGPNALKVDMSPETLRQTLMINLDSFSGYVGVNNHMGSRLTADASAMEIVMPELAHTGLLFLDSLTTGKSVARRLAQENGIPFHARDVFIDHEETAESAQGALAHLENLARKNGTGIAIGHPKAETISALAAWIPTLGEKGLVLVPLSRLYSSPEVSSSGAADGNTRSSVR